MATGRRGTVRDRIVDAALALGEERGWSNVRLYQVAERAGVPLGTIGSEFRDMDALANAWFARALGGRADPAQALAGQPPPERLHLVIMHWFDALAPHREVTGEMLRAKLYPSHPQYWVPLIFDLSRRPSGCSTLPALPVPGARGRSPRSGSPPSSLAACASGCAMTAQAASVPVRICAGGLPRPTAYWPDPPHSQSTFFIQP